MILRRGIPVAVCAVAAGAAAVAVVGMEEPELSVERTAAAAPFVLYLSPGGNDANNGTSRKTPLRTLNGANAALKRAAPKPGTHVQVRIMKGVYQPRPGDAAGAWNTAVPGGSITFLPDDPKTRPVFRGDNRPRYWLKAVPPTAKGGAVRLRFQGLQVEHYLGGGLSISGGTTVVDGRRAPVPGSYGANESQITNMVFRKIGNKHVKPAKGTTAFGYSAITLENARKTLVKGNTFTELENVSPHGGYIHALYLAHGANSNTITGNTFKLVSSDPVRVRNDSNANAVTGNTFTRSGVAGFFSDWFCDSRKPNFPKGKVCTTPYDPKKPAAKRQASECASHRNVVRGNKLVSGYYPKLKKPLAAALLPGDQKYAGAHPACDNKGEPRFYS